MNSDINLSIDITKDTVTPETVKLVKALASSALRRHVGAAVLTMTQAHLRTLSGNAQGWPSTGFYKKAALGARMEATQDGARILLDNEDAPGALKHQYNQGQDGRTTINMKDKLLTIPARSEFYGHSAGEFSNLRFVMFASGTKALVIGTGGAERVDFGGGRSNTKGIGARTRSMVAYWLKESVEQDAKPEVLPTKETYLNACRMAIEDGLAQMTGRNN